MSFGFSTVLFLVLIFLTMNPNARWGDSSSDDSSVTTQSGVFDAADDDSLPRSTSGEREPELNAASIAIRDSLLAMFSEEDIFSTLDDMVDVIGEEELGGIGSGLDFDDLLDAIGDFFDTERETKPTFSYASFPPVDIGPSTRASSSRRDDERELIWDFKFKPGTKYLVSLESNLCVEGEDGILTVVGYAPARATFRLPLIVDDAFDAAESLSEETKAKNTGLGFSTFVHLIAQMILCHTIDDSIYESPDGHDVLTPYGSMEVKGHNWFRTHTACDFILSKYRLILCCLEHTDELTHLITLADKEDARDTGLFKGSAFDQGASPYTEQCDRLHDLTDSVNGVQRSFLVESMKHWISIQPRIVRPTFEEVDVPNVIWAGLLRGAKRSRQDQLMFPSPLRVLSPDNNVDTDLMEKLSVRPYIGSEYIGSTYHSCPPHKYSLTHMMKASAHSIKAPMEDNEKVQHWLFGVLMSVNYFQSAYVESELLGKIWGSDGCFYSKYSRVGVCWKRLKSNSTVYYVSYYAHAPPPDEETYGIWRKVTPGLDEFWQSPTFKINISDQAFAALLPYRILTQVASVLAYCRASERAYVISRLLLTVPILSGSSWRTSAFAGDSRFQTLCTIGMSGDPPGMIKAAIGLIGDKPLSSCDVAYFSLLRESYMGAKIAGQTPLLKLPLRFLAIEKDLPLAMMWHIRGKEHDTRCLSKIIKSAVEEQSTREAYVGFLQAQADYLEKMITEGVTQQEFNSLMDSKPPFPCYNHIVMMVCSSMVSSEMATEAMSREWGTNVSLTAIFTDHNAQKLEPVSDLSPASVLRDEKVHDGLKRVLDKHDSPRSIYTLLSRQARGAKIPFVFGMHAKDAKSSDREIAQMHMDMRPQQAFSEGACAVYCEAEECDMMLNHEKPSLFVTRFTEVIAKRGTVSSEDKSFFCGRLLPECMSLSTAIVARDTGSTMLVSSSGLQRMDTSRWIVLPVNADPSCVPPCLPQVKIVRVEHKQRREVTAFRVHVHMQQGIRALGAAVHATTYTKGMQMLLSEMSSEFGEHVIMTTSDDAVRGRIPPEKPAMDRSSTEDEFFYRPLQLMEHVMMLNNQRKLMVLRTHGEFNNMVVNMHGMIPQQFIHAHLAIQPLLGQSLATDLVAAVSNARSTLMWGDSLDVASTAYESYLVLIKQKWLLTDAECDLLTASGFIPNSDEELVAGFAFRDRQLIERIWALFDDEAKDQVLCGHLSFLSALSSFSLARGEEGRKKKTKKLRDAKPLETPHLMLGRTSRMILASRKHRQALSAKYNRPIDPKKRSGAKNALMNSLMSSAPPVSDELYAKLVPVVGAPFVVIEPRKPRSQHVAPQHQGSGASSRSPHDLDVILAFRQAKINLRRLPTREEIEVSCMSDQELLEWITRREREIAFRKLGFVSASGLPRFMFYNGKSFEHPRSFSYSVDSEATEILPAEFTYKTTSYTNFQAVNMGGFVLTTARIRKAVIAFGKSRTPNGYIFFYKPKGEAVSHIEVDDDGQNYKIIKKGNTSVLCMLKNDNSPVDIRKFVPPDFEYPTHVTGLVGDPVAVLNYGNYINTSSRKASSTMREILRSLKTERPGSIIRYLPTYPSFHPAPVEIQRGRTTILSGWKSSRKLRLSSLRNDPPNVVNIDLSGDVPIQINDSESDSGFGDFED